MKQRVLYHVDVIRWKFNDNFHRDGDLPAGYYFRNGKLISIRYHQYGTRHCSTGPAFIHYRRKIKKYFYQAREYASLEQMQMVEACR